MTWPSTTRACNASWSLARSRSGSGPARRTTDGPRASKSSTRRSPAAEAGSAVDTTSSRYSEADGCRRQDLHRRTGHADVVVLHLGAHHLAQRHPDPALEGG